MFRSRLRHRAKKELRSDDLSRHLVAITDPASAASEAYRTLRTNLLYAFVDAPPKVIAVTSQGTMEGKSTTCANLGVVLAQAEKNTLIVDCDLRKPALQKMFGLRNVSGIVNFLAGEYGLEELWQDAASKNLKVLTTGPIPPNPAELLSSRRFAEFIARVREEFDYVLLDAPPAQPVSDAAIIATQADGLLIVLDAQRTRKVDLRRAVRNLETVGGNILGMVMNNTDASNGVYYSNYPYG